MLDTKFELKKTFLFIVIRLFVKQIEVLKKNKMILYEN